MFDNFEEFLTMLRERSERYGFVLTDGMAVEKTTGLCPVAAVYHDCHQGALSGLPNNNFAYYYARSMGIDWAVAKAIADETPGIWTGKVRVACGLEGAAK